MPEKKCPACGEAFCCKSDDIERCQCVKIQLSEQTLLNIKQQFPKESCLCKTCLREQETKMAAEQKPEPPFNYET